MKPYLFLKRTAFCNRDVFFFVCNFRLFVCQSCLLLPCITSSSGLTHTLFPGVQLGSCCLKFFSESANLCILHIVRGCLTAGSKVKQSRTETKIGGSESSHVGTLTEVRGHGAQETKAIVSVQKRFTSSRNVDGMRGVEEAGTGQTLRYRVAGAIARLVVVKTRAVAGLGRLAEPTRLSWLVGRVVQVGDTQIVQGLSWRRQCLDLEIKYIGYYKEMRGVK